MKIVLFSEHILSLVPLPTKGAKSLPRAENLNKLFGVKGGKFKLSVQGPWDGIGTKVKIPSEISS